MKLISVRLLVTDFDACFRFYRDVMEFPVTWGAEGEGYADFFVGTETSFSLFEQREMSVTVGTLSLPPKAAGQDRAALIFQVDDVDTAVEQLQQRGANILVGPTSHPEWGIRTAHLRDPDGNLIEINSPMAQEEWTEELQEEGQKYS